MMDRDQNWVEFVGQSRQRNSMRKGTGGNTACFK